MSVRSCTPSCVLRGRWLVVSGATLALAASLSLAAPAAAQGSAAQGRGALPVLAGAPTAGLASTDQALTEVTVSDAGFQPDEVTIAVGSIVRWTNNSPSAHTVTSDAGLFHRALGAGESYALQFLSRGTFSYRCLYHQHAGRVIVESQAPGTPTRPPTPGAPVEPGADTIVFDYFADGTSATHTDLFLIEPDGSDRRALTSTTGTSEAQPSWSPDRNKVAFSYTNDAARRGPWRLAVLDLTTGQSTPLTQGSYDYEPDWRPDGSWIVYTSVTQSAGQLISSQIVAVRPDGSQPQALVRVNSSLYAVANPSWSPDGQRIAFDLASTSSAGELYVFDVRTGTVARLLEHPGWNDLDPAWSPDGRFIAFASGPLTAPARHDIWMLDTVTGVAGSVVHVPGWDLRGPSWSGDGTRLVFSAQYQTEPAAAWGLYVVPAFGGAAAQPLTAGVEPDWGRAAPTPPTAGPTPTATWPLPPLPPDPPTLEPPSTLPPPPMTPGPSPTPPEPPTFAWPTLTPVEPTPTQAPSSPTVPPVPATATETPGPEAGAPIYIPVARTGRAEPQ